MDLLVPALRYFHEVARAGSVAGAARRLHVAPSAVSRQVASLERDFGVALFERHSRGMSLSDAGVQLLAHVRASERAAEAVVEDVRSGRGRHARTVTVAATEGFTHRLLPDAMATHRDQHPGTRFRLVVTGAEEATRLAREGEVDLAVTYALGPPRGVRVEQSVATGLHAVVAAGREPAGRSSVGLRDLVRHPLALADESTTQRQLFDLCCEAEGVEVEPALVSTSLQALLGMARRGAAVALLSGLTLAAPGDAGQEFAGLVAVPVVHPLLAQRSAQVQTMSGRVLPATARAFTALASARLAAGAAAWGISPPGSGAAPPPDPSAVAEDP
ncbi:LysR family transcriptional regulator [Kineococcus sp. SYSU DK018]|uniref:LysR family transcriptional regulator n=1 Tax=Kineococcus sp. SYSU DK018 TaxID=3383139 RepID=UPI003D7D160F